MENNETEIDMIPICPNSNYLIIIGKVRNSDKCQGIKKCFWTRYLDQKYLSNSMSNRHFLPDPLRFC